MALTKNLLFRNRGGDLLFKVQAEAILLLLLLKPIQSDEADPCGMPHTGPHTGPVDRLSYIHTYVHTIPTRLCYIEVLDTNFSLFCSSC